VGNLAGHRMITLYVAPDLYEQVRCAAYILDENIYEFVGKAFEHAINTRLDKRRRKVVEAMAKQSVANGGKRRSRRNPAL
jgi:hypothetical protein